MRPRGVLRIDPGQWLDVEDIDGRLVSLGALENSLHPEKRLAGDHATQTVKRGFRDEEVGGAGPLAADRHAGNGHGNGVRAGVGSWCKGSSTWHKASRRWSISGSSFKAPEAGIRPDADAVALCVLQQRVDRVEAHRQVAG